MSGSQPSPLAALSEHRIVKQKISKTERLSGIRAVSCVPEPWNQLRFQVTDQCVVFTAPAKQAFSTRRRSVHAINVHAVTIHAAPDL
jgi:hypothetical protein